MESAGDQEHAIPKSLYEIEVAIEARSQIRLLELLPGAYDNDRICCRLHAANLQDATFEALSYTWGANSLERTIRLNSVADFDVTDNLFAALRRLRHPTEGRILWVDALCINQQDLSERAQQVQLMGDLYEQARRVIIWLGDATEPVHVQHSPFQPRLSRSLPECPTNVPNDHEDRMMRTLDTATSATVPRYWTRTWIIQELVLAQDLVVQFGEFEVSWTQLGILRERTSAMMEISSSEVYADDIMSFLGDNEPERGSFGHYFRQYRLSDFDDGYLALNTLRTFKDTWSGLADIASSTPHNQATDLRDRVYGYYGLWSGKHTQRLEVDYRKPVSLVFADATHADMVVESNLRILNWVRPMADTIQNLPSWALDFSFGGLSTDVPFYPKTVAQNAQQKLHITLDAGRLSCKGHIIDCVREVHPLPRSLLYPREGEEQMLSNIMSGIPLHDAYAAVREAHPLRADACLERPSESRGIRRSLPSEAESLAFDLGVPTDPLSNVFLWWLSKVRGSLPLQNKFTDLFEWWRCYSKYAATIPRDRGDVFIITNCGFLGRGLRNLSSGDLVVFLHGLELPVILKRQGQTYAFKGLAWINGVMLGELEEIVLQGNTEHEFVLT